MEVRCFRHWESDIGASYDYQANVSNAFVTASRLAPLVNAVADLSVFATNTVFSPSPESILNPRAARLETDFHLAQGIPALSPPTGRPALTENLQLTDVAPECFVR